MALPFVLYLMLGGKLPRLWGYAILAILLFALVLAASVTALSCALLGLFVFALVAGTLPSVRAMATVGIAVAIYLASGGGVPQAFSTRIAPALENENIAQAGSYIGRLGLIEEAWGLVEKTTFLGLGVDQYRHVSFQGAPVHNMYLLVWAEGGIWSLMGWVGLITLLVTAGASALPIDRRAAGLALSLVSMLILASTASPHMYARMWLTPVFLAIGYALAARQPAIISSPRHGLSKQVQA